MYESFSDRLSAGSPSIPHRAELARFQHSTDLLVYFNSNNHNYLGQSAGGVSRQELPGVLVQGTIAPVVSTA